MTEAPSRAGSLALVGNCLALDFANTASGRSGPRRLEHLQAPAHLLLWSRHAGRSRAGLPESLPELAEGTPTAWRILAEALELREAIHAVAAAMAAGAAPPAGELETIARHHCRTLAEAALRPGAGRLAWLWPGGGAGALLGAVALSAVELLTGAEPRRIRRCPGADCGWVFLDTSKAGRRRWCEMEVCGNRAKARRQAERRRIA